MSGGAPVDPVPPAGLDGACIGALAKANLLAYGAVREGVLAHASAALRRMFALPEGQKRTPFAELVVPADRERLARALAAPGRTPVAFRAVRRDGSEFEAELSAVPAVLPDGPAVAIVLVDLTDRERAARPLSYLALIDTATGLANRQAFLDRLQVALSAARRAGRPAIAMLVQFERSEVAEPRTRDAILRDAAERLRRRVRETDLVARLDEAQFGILLPRVEERASAALVAGRVLSALAGPASPAAGDRTIIGIAAYPDDASSAESLLECARAALAEAGREEGNRFAFAPARSAGSAQAASLGRWSARYDVGIEVLDGQHRELLDLINRLGDGLRSGRDFNELVEVLKELVRYTEHHFNTEERLMDELGARSERHRAEHRRLLSSLMAFPVRLDPEGVGQTADFLQDWLFRHIDEVDRPFAAFLRNHGVT